MTFKKPPTLPAFCGVDGKGTGQLLPVPEAGQTLSAQCSGRHCQASVKGNEGPAVAGNPRGSYFPGNCAADLQHVQESPHGTAPRPAPRHLPHRKETETIQKPSTSVAVCVRSSVIILLGLWVLLGPQLLPVSGSDYHWGLSGFLGIPQVIAYAIDWRNVFPPTRDGTTRRFDDRLFSPFMFSEVSFLRFVRGWVVAS